METYIPRFFKKPEQSFFLFGPRGTGKSTYLNNHYNNALWIDLLKPDVFRNYSAKPERLIDLVHGNPEKTIVIVDEVQKVPELLSVVHSLIEEKARFFVSLVINFSKNLLQIQIYQVSLIIRINRYEASLFLKFLFETRNLPQPNPFFFLFLI